MLEEEIIEKKIKLIILDSVASLVRKEYNSRGGKSLIDRTNLLAKQAATLKYIAENFHIPVSISGFISVGDWLNFVLLRDHSENITGMEVKFGGGGS